MKVIKDLIPRDQGAACIVALSTKEMVGCNYEDEVIARSIFNFDYLKKLMRELEKEIGKTDNKRLIELQFVTSKMARRNNVSQYAITLRATIPHCFVPQDNPDPVYDKKDIKPRDGYYAVGPVANNWLNGNVGEYKVN